MVKHWKVMMTTVFIIVIFSFFYIQLKKEVETYPSFALETKKGDVEAVTSIELQGDYQTENSSQSFTVNLEGTTYIQQMPYLQRLSGFYKYKDMERLKQLYPAYMRGKEDALSTYTENDLYVVQAGMQWGEYGGGNPANIAFNLSVLHKELNKQARFNISMPEADQETFMSLEDMYAVGEQLYLITSHLRNVDKGLEVFELRVYTVQLDRGKITNSDVIYTWNQESPLEEIMITSIENNHTIMADQRMLLLKRVIQEGVPIENELEIDKLSGDVSHELIAYDFRTKGLETYQLPSQVKNGARFISYEDNSNVYMIQENDEDLVIIEWKLGSDEQPDPLVVPIDGPVKSYTTSLIGEYLYVYARRGFQENSLGEVHALYVPTGEWVYTGEVTIERPLTDEEEVIINEIE